MKRRAFALFLTVAVLLMCLPVMSAETLIEGAYTYTVSDGQATITDCDPAIGGEVAIPSSLGGYPVTTIGSVAFASRVSLTKATIPQGVTAIENGAFLGCSGLMELSLPDTLESVGDGAFSNCALTDVTYASSSSDWEAVTVGSGNEPLMTAQFTYVEELPVTVGDFTFTITDGMATLISVNKALSGEVTIPNVVNECFVVGVGEYAFSGCRYITSVTNVLTTIGDYAFENCTALESVTLGRNLQRIGMGAF